MLKRFLSRSQTAPHDAVKQIQVKTADAKLALTLEIREVNKRHRFSHTGRRLISSPKIRDIFERDGPQAGFARSLRALYLER